MRNLHIRFFAAFFIASLTAINTSSANEVDVNSLSIHVSEIAGQEFVGRLYRLAEAPSKQQTAVLVLGGSEGALRGGMPAVARSLAGEGFVALHLAYFGDPGLPRDLELIQIEYFQAAITWLLLQPNVAPGYATVVGASKGAEAALVLSTIDPRVRMVVAGAPSSYVWPGLNACESGHSSWKFKGAPIPALPCGTGPKVKDAYSAYTEGLKFRSRYPDTAIPVESSKANILLICGERDTMNPACAMSRQLMKRAKRTGRVSLLAYSQAGHLGFGVPVHESNPRFAMLGSLGGSPHGNALAREQSWPKVVAFLKQSEPAHVAR